jgi:Spy/CpxP family protein refolding chaperone
MQLATRAFAWLCLAAIVAAGPGPVRGQEHPQEQTKPAAPQGQGSQDRWFWWKDAAVQKELGLSGRQVGKIDKVFTGAVPAIRTWHKEMEGLEEELSRLIRENTADEKLVALQIDRVEARRSEINKARTLMLYRMHRVLTPEQYQGLTKLLERRRKDRGGRR